MTAVSQRKLDGMAVDFQDDLLAIGSELGRLVVSFSLADLSSTGASELLFSGRQRLLAKFRRPCFLICSLLLLPR